MESNDGGLNFKVRLPDDQLAIEAARVKAQLQGIGDTGVASGARLDNAFNQAGKSVNLLGNDINSLQRNILTLASVSTLGRLGKEIIFVRGEFQQLGIAFETMLGSKEKSDRLMAEQIALAQKTPFTLVDVATNTKQLLAMGIGYEKVMQTMKDLGNVAAGVSVPLSRIAINYGQVATLGKLQQREIRDFAMAGIPIIDELAKNLGKAKDEILGMVEAGQIGFPEVEKAFQTMSGEGGKFYNLMEKQNASVTGQISNLTDKLQVMMNDLGKSNEGLIYGGISGVVTLVENYKGIIDVLEVLAITYGTVKAAQIAVTAYESVMAGIDATRTKIIAGKVAALQAEFAVQDAAAAKAKILAAEETSRAAKQMATEQALTASEARITAAKIANVKATQDLAAAELELQIAQARNTAGFQAGFLSLKQSKNVKAEMAAVDKAYSTLKKTEVAVDKAITADTILNERVKAQAVRAGEAEKTAAKVQATAASRALMVANEQATASEIAMAAVNPWMIAAAGIAVLVGALIYFKKDVKTTEELVTDLNKSVNDIGKQIELESAINKYESLKDKVGKTEEEQTELNKSIKTLSAIFPDAIGKSDQYGKAIDLVAEKLKNASKEAKENVKALAEANKIESEIAQKKLIAKRNEYQEDIQRGYVTTPDEEGVMRKTPLSKENILFRRKEIATLNGEIESLGATIGDASSKIYELASVGAEDFIAKNAELFKEIGKYSRSEALKASSELLSMLGTEGGRADAVILKQVSALKEHANSIKTIKEEIAQTQKDLADGEQKLAKMRLPGYESTNPKKDIEEQEAVNKELKTKIESLTGIKEKAAKKQLKTEQEKLDALRDLALEELEIYQNLEQSKTDAMIDGERKQRKIIEDSYKSQLLTIEKNKQDFLEKLNKSKGLVSTDSGYVKTLPVDIQSQFDQMAINAHQKRDNAILKLDQDLIKNQNAIWDSATESFLSDVDKQIKTINKKYDDLIEQQKQLTPVPTGKIDELTGNIVFNPEELKQYQAAMKAFDLINANRQKELDRVNQETALKLSPLYQKAFGDIEKYGTKTLVSLKKQLEDLLTSAKQISVDGKTMIQVSMPNFDASGKKISDFTNMSIEEFTQWKNKVNDVTNIIEKKNPFLALGDAWRNYQKTRKDYNEALKTGDEKSINATREAMNDASTQMLSVVGMIAEKIKQISDDLKEAGDYLGGDFGNAIGKVGDTLSAIMEFGQSPIKGIISLLKIFTNSNEVSEGTIAQYKTLISTIDEVINKQKALLESLSGASAVSASKETIALIEKQIEASRNLGLEYLNSGANWKSHSHGYDLHSELQQYAEDFNNIGIDFASLGGRMEGLFSLTPAQLEAIKEQLPEAWAKLDDSTKEYLQNIIDGGDALKDMTDALNESLTNLSFDSARSSLEELLLSADTTMSDVADNFEEYMRRAIVNMISNQDLLPALEKWYQDFSDAMADGVLTETEKTALQAGYTNIFSVGKSKTDAAYSAAGIDASSSTRTGSSKGIAQASQDSTDETNGRLTVMQSHTFNMSRGVDILVSNSNQILIQVKGIKTDTARLENIENSLADVKSGIDTINLKGITLK